jgi:excisionase family DNA binding protein
MEPIGLSLPDTGKALGGEGKPLSKATLYRKISSGELEAIKIGGRTLITTASIKALVAAAPRLGSAG